MRIGIIGGTEKNIARYEELARALACEVEFHDGRMAGRGSQALEMLVKRCDVAIVIIQINSHAAARNVLKLSRRYGCRVQHVRRFGLHAFAHVVHESRLARAG